ncbi:MAG: hypothetical protein Q9167_005427 [Letrouitia subvulpina]
MPQDANTSDGLWQMLCEGRSAATQIPRERFNIDAFYHPDPDRIDATNVRTGNFLAGDIASFDAPFFSIQPTEVASMDPQQRLLLEESYKALENAGISMKTIAGSNTSVYVGSSARDYEALLFRDPEVPARYVGTGIGTALLANRISWFYDLQGPSIALDTACSSGLTAVHLACQNLRSYESRMALAGGCSLILAPDVSMVHLSNMGFFSPDGQCYSFDDRANGYAKGEGGGFIVLKRLSDALKDGDTIRAVIRASGVNQDGRTPGITQPSKSAQKQNILETYRAGGIDLDSTRYIEAHGTGTQIGDSTEAEAIAAAFHRTNDNPLMIGALKPNIGHLESASGVASLIKTVLVLENGLIPPNLFFNKPNANIHLDQWHIQFPVKPTPWPTTGLRRASVNSFGYGGTNTHLVLEDAFNYLQARGFKGNHCTVSAPPSIDDDESFLDISTKPDRTVKSCNDSIYNGAGPPQVFILSAADEHGVYRTAASLEDYLRSGALSPREDRDHVLQDLAYTLSEKRTKLPWQSFVIAHSIEELQENMSSKLPKPVRHSTSPTISFIFTGQGAQWAGMGQGLDRYPVFHISLEKSTMYLQTFGCQWNLLNELQKDQTRSDISSPEKAQPLCTAVQIALVDLLASWRISPRAVLGHSSGEIAAAYCARSLSHESSIKVAFYRGTAAAQVASSTSRRGGMMSVALSEEAIVPSIDVINRLSGSESLAVGCVNSPTNVTVTGDQSAIDSLKTSMDEKGVFARKLPVNVAYHSAHMQPIAAEYSRKIRDLEQRHASESRAKIPVVFSSVNGSQLEPKRMSETEYWVTNLVSPVRFSNALQQLIEYLRAQKADSGDEENLFLEIGPTSALQRPVADTIKYMGNSKAFGYDTVLKRNCSSLISCMELIGRLRVRGCDLDLLLVNNPDLETSCPQLLTNLPHYPFNHSQSHWTESRTSRSFRMRKHPRHELLGAPVADWNHLQPKWRNIIRVKENPWILDHAMGGSQLYPASAMITMVIEGIRQLADLGRQITGYRFQDVVFHKALPIPSAGPEVETQLYFNHRKFATSHTFETNDFVIYAYLNEEWSSLCEGTVMMEYENQKIGQISNPDGLDHDTTQLLTEKQCRDEIHRKQFYQNLSNYGFQYGPTFQLLQKIHFNQNGQARGTIDPDGWKDHNHSGVMQDHIIHPTALDCLGQVSMAAISNGSWDAIPTMVPTRLASLWISQSLLHRQNGSEIDLYASRTFRGYREAELSIFARNSEKKTVIAVEGWRETALNDIDHSALAKSQIRCYRVLWRPDPGLLTPIETANAVAKPADNGTTEASTVLQDRDYIKRLESACMFYLKSNIDRGTLCFKSLPALLQRWVTLSFPPADGCNSNETVMHRNDVERMLEENTYADKFLEDVAKSSAEGSLLINLGTKIGDIRTGENDAQDINRQLMTEYLRIPAFVAMYTQITAYVDLLAHKKPHQRILEVNSGDGAMTDVVLNTLALQTPQAAEPASPKFSHYSYTDSSQTLIKGVEDRYQKLFRNISCKTLDIGGDLANQGFISESYDVVIGHALRTPALSAGDWQDVLVKTGFTDPVCISGPNGLASHAFSILIATADETVSESSNPALVFVVANKSTVQAEIASKAISSLRASTASACEVRSLQDVQATSQNNVTNVMYVCLLDVEAAFLGNICEESFAALKTMVFSSKGVLWVSRGGGSRAPRPDSGLVTGFGRNILSENWNTKFIELAIEIDSPVARIVDHVTKVILTGLFYDSQETDTEFRENDGQLCIGRVISTEDLDQMVASKTTIVPPENQRLGQSPHRALSLTIGSPGLLNSLHFQDDPVFDKPLADDEVEIKVRATGMNFKDVVIALGQLAGDALGYECAGIVTRAGRLADFQLGDRVCCCTTTGAYKTFARAHATSVAKIPERMTYSAAATLPLVFCTAHYSLVTMAHLQKGESVLIHSGAGGVGQAAITIAKQLDATIYTTVSTEEKKRFLVNRYQIPESHIFSSRTPLFAKTLLRMGQGVDVVLNSLSGEMFRASWSCIAPFGRFIELGKSDINSRDGLPMSPFNRNVTFTSVDLGLVMDHAKGVMRSTLRAVMAQWNETGGQMGACPLQVYKVSELEKAFRTMQSGTNIGKIVIEMDEAASVNVVPAIMKSSTFDPNATYVIAGGFGGIGRSITRWMADRNARNFVLLSRSGHSSKSAISLLREMNDRGIKVHAPACDISDEVAVSNVFKRLIFSIPPIKGCIQASMVLKDGLLENTSLSDFTAVLKPKFNGSWNLHLHLPDNLDFFILLSSVSGVTGARAQAAYAAGNTFQNALARHRVSLGHKCISLDLGPISAIGAIAERDLSASLEAIGLQTIGRNQLFALLDYCCDASRPLPSANSNLDESQIITGLGGADKFPPDRLEQIYWTRKPLFSVLRQTIRSCNSAGATPSPSSGPDNVHLLHVASSAAAAAEVVTAAIVGKVAQNLNVSDAEIDAQKPIHAYGIDSLVALEVRYWFAKEIGSEVTILEIMQAKSLRALAALAAGRSQYIQGRNEGSEHLNGSK